MFQSVVNVKQAFGIVGEIYELTPYIVDAKNVSADVEIGMPVGRSSDGKFGKMDNTTYTNFVGIAVRGKEHIHYSVGTSTDAALKATMVVPAGTTVSVASMGRICIALPSGVNASEGADLYVTPAGAYSATASGNTKIGKVIVGGVAGETIAVEL